MAVSRPDPKRVAPEHAEHDRHVHTDTHPAELTETEAKQASRNPFNFYVLVASFALAVIAGLLIWLAFAR